jgi:hypothetical protein
MTRIETHGHRRTAKVVDLAEYRQARSMVSGRPAVQMPLPGPRALSPRQAVHRRRMLAHLVDLAVRR